MVMTVGMVWVLTFWHDNVFSCALSATMQTWVWVWKSNLNVISLLQSIKIDFARVYLLTTWIVKWVFFHTLEIIYFKKNAFRWFFFFTSNAMSWWVYTKYRLVIPSAPPISVADLDWSSPSPLLPKIYEVKFKIWDKKWIQILELFRDLSPFWRASRFRNFCILYCIWQTEWKIPERDVTLMKNTSKQYIY
jgi:hypothetical protein